MFTTAETTVRSWSTTPKKIQEGVPPKPEDNPSTHHEESLRSSIRTITPSYKSDAYKSSQDVSFGSNYNLQEPVGDYKVKEMQDHYKLQMIDPKVSSNASMPYESRSIQGATKRTLDFPSEHSKRSFLKLDPLERRRIRSVETRPLTTSAYLTESVDRHRDMEASRLREYLRARESDANKPWNKPDWPGPKGPSDTNMKELQDIRKTMETLQKAMSKPPKNDDLDELARLNERLSKRSKARCTDYKLVNPTIIKTSPEPVSKHIKESIREVLESRTSNDNSYHSTSQQNDRSGYLTDASSATWQFSTHSFSPRSVVSINGGTRTDNGLLKVRTDLSPSAMRSSTAAEMHTAQYQTQKQHWPYMPAHLGSAADSSQSTVTREFTENYSGHADRYASLPALDNGSSRGTLITIKDDKPRGIMKRKEMENKHEMMYSRQPSQWESKQVVQKPKVIETVQRFEEHKRTEEVERRIQRKEKKERSHKSSQRRVHHHSSGNRTGSASRHNGGSPARESYTRTYSSRRERDGKFPDGGRQYVSNGTADYDRYGSLSDSLRRGELKYNPNGEIREVYQSSRDGRVHRSYSTRDIFDTGNYDGYRSSPSYHRGNDPLVEYPPTLPRGDRCAPIPPPHRVNDSNFNDYYRPISKSRSYADWDEGRGFEHAIKRRDNDMARLENEFRDSLLMPMPKPGSAINEKEYRREQLPGGYESYDRQFKASSGQRLKRNGNPAQFNEASEEFNYTRETESDRRN